MNHYETLKDQLILKLTNDYPDLPIERLSGFLSALDCVVASYNIEPRSTEIIPVESGVPTLIKMFIATKAIEQKSQGTLRNYTVVLTNFFRAVNRRLKDITSNDIRVYFHCYQQDRNVASSTIETMRHVFNSFFAWCVAEGHIDSDPMARIHAIKFVSKERQFLEPIELEWLRDACENVREKAVVDFLFSTGCRVSEMCNVLLSEVDFDKRSVLIKNGKGGKSRFTYLNAEAAVSLKAYLDSRKDSNPISLYTCKKSE